MMESDYKSASNQISESESVSYDKAQANVEQLSAMIESGEETDTSAGETTEKLKSIGLKGIVAATAAVSVMGITNLMQADKGQEMTPSHIEPAPIEEIVQAPKPAFNLEESPEDKGAITFVESEIETKEFTWWHNVPAISQQELTYQNKETDYGCAPTAVSMVTEYWHTQDPNNETRSAQALLDANVEQGMFVGRGMSVTHLHDELSALGYEARDYADADLETLKREVAKGPVVAAVKLGMGTDGTSHTVVVTGISENKVRVSDPWNGESRAYSWETFSRSWGSAFKGISSRNHFTVIRPT